MKIFDTRWNGPHGIGRFSREIFTRLAGFSPITIEGSPSSPMDPLILGRHLRSIRPSLFFSPGYNAPIGASAPFVFCIHDLNHLHVPQNSNSLKRAYYEIIIRRGVHRSRAVLTVSEFSRAAICEWTGISEDRVVNVGNGVSSTFNPVGGQFDRIDHPYFLHTGNHKPHKNFQRLLRAFAASRLDDFYLMSTGEPSREIRHTIAKLGLSDRVCFFPGLSDRDLAAAYRSATALVLVSLYEGFGLPIVEAMASGTPVLSSCRASMPEVAGNAAILVDPTNIESIRDALLRLASDASLRQDLIARGLERAKQYSWDATANRVNETLKRIA